MEDQQTKKNHGSLIKSQLKRPNLLCIVHTTQWTTLVRVQATATEKNGIVRSIKCVISKINTYVIQIPLEPRYEWVGFSSLVAVPIFIVICKNQ